MFCHTGNRCCLGVVFVKVMVLMLAFYIDNEFP